MSFIFIITQVIKIKHKRIAVNIKRNNVITNHTIKQVSIMIGIIDFKID